MLEKIRYMRFNVKPYDLLVPVLVILLAMYFFIPTYKTLDIHLWDSYYIITLRSVCLISALFLVLLWILYRLTSPFLFSKQLTWIHVVLTLAILSFLVVAPLISDSFFNPPPVRFQQLTYPRLFGSRRIVPAMAILLGVFFLSQIIYLVNILAGILNKFIK